jgi:hypothetical protein
MKAVVMRNLPVLTALLYGTVSTSITFFNKAVLSVYQFRQPNIMTLAQILLSLCFLQGMKLAGWIQFADFEWSRAKRVFPLAVSFIGMVLTGLSALNYLNVPMFSALRRVTTLVTMYCEVHFCFSYALTLSTHSSSLLPVVPAQLNPLQENSRIRVSDGRWRLCCCVLRSRLQLLRLRYGRYQQLLHRVIPGLHCYLWQAGPRHLGIDVLVSFIVDVLQIIIFAHLISFFFHSNNLLSLPLVILVCIINDDFTATMEYPHLADAGFWV